MPLHIQVAPEVIGVAVDNDTGNPIVLGHDRSTGIHVSIMVDAAYWQRFLENAQRLKGVGISLPAGAVGLNGGADAGS